MDAEASRSVLMPRSPPNVLEYTSRATVGFDTVDWPNHWLSAPSKLPLPRPFLLLNNDGTLTRGEEGEGAPSTLTALEASDCRPLGQLPFPAPMFPRALR